LRYLFPVQLSGRNEVPRVGAPVPREAEELPLLIDIVVRVVAAANPRELLVGDVADV